MYIAYRKFPLKGELNGQRPPGQPSRNTVGPHTKFTVDVTMARALRDDEFEALRNGSGAIFVWGQISHDGLEGEPVTRNFRYFLGGDYGFRPGFPLCPHERGNH